MTVVVEEGDTLVSIAKQVLGSPEHWRKIVVMNPEMRWSTPDKADLEPGYRLEV